MIRRATKKPVTIEFIEWDGTNAAEIETWIGEDYQSWIPSQEQLVVGTLEGEHIASKGDLIIRGVNGEHYPCKPDIFAKTYNVEESA